MLLKDFNFENIETIRIKTIGYKADYNTVCKHFYNAYPLDELFNNNKYTGFCITLIEKSVNDGGTDYNGGFYEVYNNLENNLYFGVCQISGNTDIDVLKNEIDNFIDKNYNGKKGYINFIKNKLEKQHYINNAQITTLQFINELDLAEKCKIFHDNYIDARQKENEKRKKEYLERKEKERKEAETAKQKQIEGAIETLKNKGNVKNDDKLVLDLLKYCQIKIPIKTQGWIINNLYSIFYNNNKLTYNYYKRSKNANGSQSFFKCLYELENYIKTI